MVNGDMVKQVLSTVLKQSWKKNTSLQHIIILGCIIAKMT